MNKKLIRLTESDLHRIVKESLKKVLKENVNEIGLNDELCQDEGFKKTYISREIRKIYNILDNLKEDREGISWKGSPNLSKYLNEIEFVVDNITSVIDGHTNGRYGNGEKPMHYNDAFKIWQERNHSIN